MERQYKYKVNRNIALNEIVESTVSNRRVALSTWSHDSDWITTNPWKQMKSYIIQ